jgi:hypothetical protein
MPKRPTFKVYDHVQDRDDRRLGRIVHVFRNDPTIVAVRFIGDRDDLAVPAESLRRAPKPKREQRLRRQP